MPSMKNKKYSHITKTERLEIAILKNRGYSIREIARGLGRSPGTLSEEIKNNSVKGVYDPNKAQHKAYVKRKDSKFQGMKIVSSKELRNFVEDKLNEDWSPEQIAGRIREIEKNIKYASKNGIYKFVASPYGINLTRHLRRKGKKGKKKYVKVGKLKDRIFIDQRPDFINQRLRFSDWEGDLIVSGKQGKGALLTLLERRANYVALRRLLSRSPIAINRIIHEITGGFVCFGSLTLDNDISFRKHERLSQMLKAPVYFCHPYHAWEKGGVENINGLVRQYIPKGSDISKYTDLEIQKIEQKLNARPRKGLGYKTPLEVMQENQQFKNTNEFAMINPILKPNNFLIPSVRLEG